MLSPASVGMQRRDSGSNNGTVVSSNGQGQIVEVDDNSSSVIYNGAWVLTQMSPNAVSGTLHSTADISATASIVFFGTEIIVIGAARVNATANLSALYTIDDMAPQSKAVPVDTPPASQFNGTFEDVVLFSATNLTAAFLTLVIDATETGGDRNFTLDYFQVTVPVADATTPVVKQKKSDTGAIAGGVGGGVALVLLLVGAYVWWRRQRRSTLQTANAPGGSQAMLGQSFVSEDEATRENESTRVRLS